MTLPIPVECALVLIAAAPIAAQDLQQALAAMDFAYIKGDVK